ncbi:hypothetical protein AVEN_55437-1 [Araneus ventricosus]|uniref:Uncharacterized protein n=1 Tax=Araneus ventricosus TaxID=182803 RepID=A0A4Y2FY83_ARAVE|nr:hypothetical protein AVEN_55437-1 [Araneus ventricosus]
MHVRNRHVKLMSRAKLLPVGVVRKFEEMDARSCDVHVQNRRNLYHIIITSKQAETKDKYSGEIWPRNALKYSLPNLRHENPIRSRASVHAFFPHHSHLISHFRVVVPFPDMDEQIPEIGHRAVQLLDDLQRKEHPGINIVVLRHKCDSLHKA